MITIIIILQTNTIKDVECCREAMINIVVLIIGMKDNMTILLTMSIIIPRITTILLPIIGTYLLYTKVLLHRR